MTAAAFAERCETADADVVIVGGGPAGATLAGELVGGGLDVIVVDRAAFPRDKVCAGWITPAVVEEVGLSVDEYGETGRTIQAITGFRVGRMDGRVHQIGYDHPVSYGIRRCELDDYLLQRAGARLVLDRRVRTLERANGHWQILLAAPSADIEGAKQEKELTIRTPLLVGAGGHGCPVARHLRDPGGGMDDEEHLVVAQEAEFELTPGQEGECVVRGDEPELYFTPDLKGYGWCFRKGQYLNVGLGRLDRVALQQHVSDFVHWLQKQRRIAFDLPVPLKGHAYLIQGQRKRDPIADGALLIGDAAGLAYPTSGEGIRPAIESALLAARVILAAPSSCRRSDLTPYRDALEERFQRLRRQPVRVPGKLRSVAARALFRSSWLVRKIVIDRWFLNCSQAPLRSAGDNPRARAMAGGVAKVRGAA